MSAEAGSSVNGVKSAPPAGASTKFITEVEDLELRLDDDFFQQQADSLNGLVEEDGFIPQTGSEEQKTLAIIKAADDPWELISSVSSTLGFRKNEIAGINSLASKLENILESVNKGEAVSLASIDLEKFKETLANIQKLQGKLDPNNPEHKVAMAVLGKISKDLNKVAGKWLTFLNKPVFNEDPKIAEAINKFEAAQELGANNPQALSQLITTLNKNPEGKKLVAQLLETGQLKLGANGKLTVVVPEKSDQEKINAAATEAILGKQGTAEVIVIAAEKDPQGTYDFVKDLTGSYAKTWFTYLGIANIWKNIFEAIEKAEAKREEEERKQEEQERQLAEQQRQQKLAKAKRQEQKRLAERQLAALREKKRLLKQAAEQQHCVQKYKLAVLDEEQETSEACAAEIHMENRCDDLVSFVFSSPTYFSNIEKFHAWEACLDAKSLEAYFAKTNAKEEEVDAKLASVARKAKKPKITRPILFA